MTTLDLRRLKLRVGDAIERDELLELDPLTIGGQTFVFDPPSPVATVMLTRAATGILSTLALTATLRGPCMRCLEDATVEVRVERTEYEATDGQADNDDELENPYLENDILDVSAWARDAALLSLPDKILCVESCAGLCSSCGRSQSEGSCSCEAPTGDSRWAKLEELRAELTD
jgi:uncharacterized protein